MTSETNATKESTHSQPSAPWGKWMVLAALTVVLDQWTKYIANTNLRLHEPLEISASFNLTLAYNKGAAFSFLHDAPWGRWFFIVLTLVAVVFLLRWLLKLPPTQRWLGVALSLILGGAVGNLIDRLWFGYVIDFIQVYYRDWYWPTFNIADSAITVGAVIAVVLLSIVGEPATSSTEDR